MRGGGRCRIGRSRRKKSRAATGPWPGRSLPGAIYGMRGIPSLAIPVTSVGFAPDRVRGDPLAGPFAALRAASHSLCERSPALGAWG